MRATTVRTLSNVGIKVNHLLEPIKCSGLSGGLTDYAMFISPYDDGTNPNHYQQQVVATVQIP
jgi:hypothetical protein